MGVTTQDIFGDRAGQEPQPALPGTYGQAPRGHRLPDATRLGRVSLQVSELQRSLAFYEGTLGFRTLARDATSAILAAYGDDRPLVELHELPGAQPMRSRGRLGLFHFAILLPDRGSLGRFIQHLAAISARAGASDHLVSEAFYLQDPDNLGIEVYADRPRDTWRRVGRELMMATDPVDAPAIVRAAGDTPWSGMPAGTTIGHVHLHVGDTARASEFFSEALGLDRMVWSYPDAIFFGAGGYHHHLGANTWAGSAAQPPGAGDARLLEWTIELPDAASVEAAGQSLNRAGYAAERDAGSTTREPVGADLVTSDPWGTKIRIRVAAGAAR